MDKNIAALLRNDVKTILVIFPNGAKTYRYVTPYDVVEGDYVVVEVDGEFKVARVHTVESDVNIEPNANIKFKWIVDVVDVTRYLADADRNNVIERELKKQYAANMRQQFREMYLASNPQIAALIGG